MAITKDIGIVLRRLDYSETSQVLAVLCRETGQQRLIARGIKRGTKTRFATGIDLLELGEVLFIRKPSSEAQLATVTDWKQLETFPSLRSGLAAWYGAQYAAERTSQLTQENDPHPGLFDALLDLLNQIRADGPMSTLIPFLWALLQEIGLMPSLDRCVGCGRDASTGDTYISARAGGVVCRDCEPATIEKRRVEVAAIRMLRESPEEMAAPMKTQVAAFDLLDYYLTEIAGKPSRIADALLTTIANMRG